jgi:hypothetical protein
MVGSLGLPIICLKIHVVPSLRTANLIDRASSRWKTNDSRIGSE